MDQIKLLGNGLLDYVKEEGVNYIKQVGTIAAINAIIDNVIVQHVEKAVKNNTMWNLILIIIVALNKFSFTPKLLMLYYVASCGMTFYMIHNILTKIENFGPMVVAALPYTIGSIRTYLYKIHALLAMEIVGIFYNWGLDYVIYALIIVITIHTLTIQKITDLIFWFYKLMNINIRLRSCVYIFVIENVGVIILYGILNF